MGYIYKIVNKINSKLYVGKTIKTIEERFNEHKITARMFKNGNYKHETKLYRSMCKYGEDNFYIELIEECEDASLSSREQYWIEHLDTIANGYNISPGGDGGPLFKGHKHTEESRRKMTQHLQNIRWFTNGEIDIFTQECPQGFRPGRTKLDNRGDKNPMYGKPSKFRGTTMSKEKRKKLSHTLKELAKTKRNVWYTNGEADTLVDLNKRQPPVGFSPGRRSSSVSSMHIKVLNLLTNEVLYFNSIEDTMKALNISYFKIRKSIKTDSPTLDGKYKFEENRE